MERTGAGKPDRVLGDEWEDWSGRMDESRSYDETARLFTLYGLIAVLIVTVALGCILYLIEPRLSMISPVLVLAARAITVAFTILLTAVSAIMIVSVFTGKSLFLDTRLGQFGASRILPLADSVARKLGVSRDRLANSFVTFSNAIVRASYRPAGGKTIILVPRCLSAEQKQELRELGESAGVGVFTATGGGQARKIILQERPASVIGIACERDLISGIHDVAPKLPTIGVPNIRPEGPCKNTRVDLEKVKQAIGTLTGKAVR
jgi:hypothetical protein